MSEIATMNRDNLDEEILYQQLPALTKSDELCTLNHFRKLWKLILISTFLEADYAIVLGWLEVIYT